MVKYTEVLYLENQRHLKAITTKLRSPVTVELKCSWSILLKMRNRSYLLSERQVHSPPKRPYSEGPCRGSWKMRSRNGVRSGYQSEASQGPSLLHSLVEVEKLANYD